MDPRELSEYLGVPVQTLANWRWRNEGPKFRRVGRHVRYRPEDVEAWLNAQGAGGSAG
ncbi:helix-turn-helix domain-containing protein [Streptomyces sp. DSM 44917]|uniref:Helix-turn-helix domain-containing protein n=1 Tax=Streptomyces boetiae TaxID=3075541 RepID=A0ABU2LCM9_9ACTN|nr:helix-turn-helix domain-containing protein [Streptomyces sp. DSM 44917]MDT0309270.1 helix-turn-helix domain-containing protein [Streptomyces sp. DSM 44917]